MNKDAAPYLEAGADRMRLIGGRRRACFDDTQDVYNAWTVLFHIPPGRIVHPDIQSRHEALGTLMLVLYEQLRMLKEDESIPLAFAHQDALQVAASKTDNLAIAARLEAPW